MFPLFHSFHSQFSLSLNFSLSPHTILQTIPSPVLLLIIPSPGTLTLTFCVLITTLLHAQLQIHPPLSFPCGPALAHAPNHPALHQVRNQISMTRGHHEGLYC